LKSLRSCLLVMLAFPLLLQSQMAPPGSHPGDSRQYDPGYPIEFPGPRHVDPAQLQRDANELSALAASVPVDIKAVNQGVLPKDFLEKLKRIEKLSKHLRSELSQ
jgi:hypothetical protein